MAKKKSTTVRDEQLIADLLHESHGLRMRYEDFSRYTESQVAEFVLTKKRLNRELVEVSERARVLAAQSEQLQASVTSLELQLSHARGDIRLLHDQRAMVQGELVRITQECTALQEQAARLTMQRDKARERVKALESSRAVRVAARLRKILRRG